MEPYCLTRKRIWEVDCYSMDAALAASFDWRDLVNILQGQGRVFNDKHPDDVLEMQAHTEIHRFCHSENDVSLAIERLLNDWHGDALEKFGAMDSEDVAAYSVSLEPENRKKMGGFFWALGTDSRKQLDCIRRVFNQRFHIISIRRFLT